MDNKNNGESAPTKSEGKPTISLVAAFAGEGEVEETKPTTPSNEVTPETSEGNQNSEGGNNDNPENETSDEDAQLEEHSKKNKFEGAAYGLHKRIGKLTARNKAAQEEIDSLKRQINELKASQSSVNKKESNNEIDNIETLDDLEKYKKHFREERQLALKLLSSSDDEFDVGENVYTRSQIVSYLNELNDSLDKKIPTQEAKIKSRFALDAKKNEMRDMAKDTFAWFADENSEGRQWIEEQLKDPELNANLYMLLAYAYEGLGVTNLRKSFKGKKVETKKVPPSVPALETGKKTISFFNSDGSLNQNLAAKHLFED